MKVLTNFAVIAARILSVTSALKPSMVAMKKRFPKTLEKFTIFSLFCLLSLEKWSEWVKLGFDCDFETNNWTTESAGL